MTGYEVVAYEELRWSGATAVESIRRAQVLQVMQWDQGGTRPKPGGWFYVVPVGQRAEGLKKVPRESLHGPVKHLTAAQYLRARVEELGAQIAASR